MFSTAGTTYRATDGRILFSERRTFDTRDKAWRVQASPDEGGGILIQDVATRATLRTISPNMAGDRTLLAVVSEDGAKVVGLSCSADGSRTLLRAFDLQDAAPGPSVQLDGECYTYGAFAISPDGNTAASAAQASGRIEVVDLEHGSLRTIDTGLSDPMPHPEQLFGGPILDLVFSPDGATLFVASDRSIRSWATRDLTEQGQPIASGYNTINQNVYAPPASLSPIAFCPRADLWAHLSPEGAVWIGRLSDGHEVFTITSSRAQMQGPGWTHDVPIDMAFLADGGGIAVSFDDRVAMWACPEEAIAQKDGEISGPTALRPGAAATFTAPDPAMRFSIDGASVDGPPSSAMFTWTATLTGTHLIEAATPERRVSLLVEVLSE
jgi:WD40 repeat protein